MITDHRRWSIDSRTRASPAILRIIIIVQEPLFVDHHVLTLVVLYEYLDVGNAVDNLSSVPNFIAFLPDGLAHLVKYLPQLLHVVFHVVYLSLIILLLLVEQSLVLGPNLLYSLIHSLYSFFVALFSLLS